MNTENNKIIAEFMINNGFMKYGRRLAIEELKYNWDWNWLMEVVEMIENIGATVIISRMFCDIKYTNPLDQSKHFEAIKASGVKINATNGAVIEFIKWYNEQKA